MCCINRQKDDLNSSSMSSVSKPVDFIRSKPGLVRVLKWFDKIEDEFKESMNDVPLPLDEIISILDDECEEEIIELSKGHEIVARVVEKSAVADIL